VSTSSTLIGRRVLVIEDESLVAMFVEDVLADLGCVVVGFASRLPEALEKATSAAFDVAILDVNLNDQQTFAVAAALISRGAPFVFATGYDGASLPEALQDIPIIRKPFKQRDLERALCAVLEA
jgi:CheY-like chemotaxis protein